MRLRWSARPEQRDEAPRIAQPEQTLADRDVDVVVLPRRGARRDEAQASRHAQVQDQVAVAAVEQKIFSAPLDRVHSAPGEAPDDRRHAPAQARLAHRDWTDSATDQPGLEAASGDLDFG